MKQLLILAMITGTANADLVMSREFSFIVSVPAKYQKIELKNALGPIATFSSVDQENGRIYHVIAHRILSYKDIPKRSVDLTKELVLANFTAYYNGGKEQGLTTTNVEKKWADGFAWPVLQYSFERQGYLENNKPLYFAGVGLLIDDTFYRLTVQSESKNGLEAAVTKFFGTFSIANEADITILEQAGDEPPTTRPKPKRTP